MFGFFGVGGVVWFGGWGVVVIVFGFVGFDGWGVGLCGFVVGGLCVGGGCVW